MVVWGDRSRRRSSERPACHATSASGTSGCEDGPVSASDPWQPIIGDDIGPTRAERSRSALVLGIVIVTLGVILAAGLGLAVVALFAVFGAAVG